MKKKLLYSLLLGLFSFSSASGADYGLPSGIQQGNILHCFDWTFSDITTALPSIAEAGFGAIQVSPVQGNCGGGAEWFYAYMPYDFVFKANGNGTRQQLQTLCDKAAEYGIKIIVDVVANHVNQAAGYHDTWWDSNGRVRWNGGCDYDNRYSITHNQLGEYGDVNSEDAQVQARAKAFITDLKSLGVKGIRWDAAKHIGLPSEGCNFWSEMASVAGLWHYGEILDGPGGDKYKLLKEYTQYIGVTDSEYSKWTLNEVESGRVPTGSGSWTANGVNGAAVVLWAESHDDYSNDGQYGKNTALVSQDKIDRAWAITACRKNETSLYFSRPFKTRRVEIKMGAKGSTNFTSKHIAEVNKFRNLMVGKEEYYSHSGSVACVTRKDGGAVIVNANGAGNISITNGGGYCPAGTYKDKVSGGTFTVTASTISGNVGSSGIAVLVADGITPPNPGPDPNPNPNPGPEPEPEGNMWILGNLEGTAGWSATPGTGAAMTLTDGKYVANGVKLVAAAGETTCYFNLTDYVGSTWDDLNMGANRYGAATEGAPITLGTPAAVVKYANQVDASGCLSWTVAAGTYDFTFDPSAMTITVVNAGDNPNPNPNPGPEPEPEPGVLTITGDYNLCYNGSLENVHYWGSTASNWPGVKMDVVKGSDGNSYRVTKVPAGTTGCLFNSNGDADKTKDLEYSGAFVMTDAGPSTTPVKFEGASPNPGPEPEPEPEGDHYIYYDGTFSTPYVWAWDGATNCTDSGKWPGDAMTKKDGMWYWELPAGKVLPHNVIISENGGTKIGDGDLDYEDKATYHQDGTHTASGPVVEKPVVTANPAGGTVFTTDNIVVTLTVSPAADIYFTLDGTAPSTSSTKYISPIGISATTTIKTLAITAEGGKSTQSFKYTKRTQGDNPVVNGKNLITDYYKVNPNGQVGTNRTVNMSFTGPNSTTALSNWKAEDLIAQGVARDVCQAFKGVHERPIVDSYALYAAYDSQNLYLGVQYVYAVWDLYGESYQPGESKPYNMDGKLCIAFDLDSDVDAKGITNEGGSIWQGKIYTTFENGSDAWWYGSTKPGAGTPGFFVPNAAGICDYTDPSSCKPSTVKYGYADGLLPSITAVYGQAEFGYDPALLEGNEGFVDLRNMSIIDDKKLEDSAHTFYEYTFPLSMLGITEDYIKNHGIGVMVCDIYGSSAHSSLPYDPCFYDHVFDSYSQDPSSSAEKEDQNVVTYAHARIGKMGQTSKVELPAVDAVDMNAEPVYYTLQGVRVENPEKGIYIVVRGNKATKEVIR